MGKNKSAWLIVAETNLHVGNENINNFGVIDQAIQRNAVTEIPCIHSSSLKGAIKEYIAECWNKKQGQAQPVSCKEVFGSEKGAKDEETQRGQAVFFDAELLALPIQETENNYYFKLAYDFEKGIQQFAAKLKCLGMQVDASNILKKICEATGIVEAQKKPVNNFKELCNDEHLPIIARNKLDNGESVNLWYEQVLPSKSVLGTVIECDEGLVNALNGKIVQIGANATVGYGYCTFVKL
ncbi:MAG: hypothetical protein IJY59_10465 [Bacteroidaceae bacterium]|nr:hypothetical protein [Bacteroidaceae bacterium]